MGFHASALPDFPWDSLAGAKQAALAHPDGIVDLSVGTPVDPTPEVARRAPCTARADPRGSRAATSVVVLLGREGLDQRDVVGDQAQLGSAA
ncbi:MAG: succinyldiaminopimelate transaminase, partial [Actinomycetes bacterium]|nr:succinyldiaminopimelate transaminase [Actinomycetes bacterium]MDX5380105.1 succinyldiaminopimelate transaminase [Actinomycetes bacterium]MDX5398702.1 succinyldiaminopimelate transaminase [Actinomycetes bacterium]MDX5449814.1 succinyldiaminopimelate transaminase [Actinomycetes bacterium]